MAHVPGVAPGTPRELLADAVDQLAEMSKTMVVKAVDSVVEPIADQGVKLAGEGMKLAGEGMKLAGEGMKLASEGVKLAGEGVKLAAAAGRLAEDRLRKVLRHRRPERPPRQARQAGRQEEGLIERRPAHGDRGRRHRFDKARQVP